MAMDRKKALPFILGPMKGDQRFPNTCSAASVLSLIEYIASLLQPALFALCTDVLTNFSPEFTSERL